MSKENGIYLLNKRVKLHYVPNGFKPGLDTVMLAASCPVKAGEHVLDMGCGVGSAGFCVLARVKGVHLMGVDIQGDHIDLAVRNARMNSFHDQSEFIAADIRNFGTDEKHQNQFDHVICNPPYLESGKHVRSPSDEKATAMGHEEHDISVEDWVIAAFNTLRGKGTLSLIHRADHLDKIIQALGKRFGGIEIIPLWPRAGEEAKRVIIRAQKHSKSPAKLHSGIVIHGKDGEYTNEAQAILRDAGET
ncbi:MAG: methyltransferase [Alphaproteobacteria bacterium]|nr:methyltransferase [Alphaproteobacteria bacterium]